MAAATVHGGSAVENIKLRDAFMAHSITSELPAMKPPKEPRAFEKVPICIIQGTGLILKCESAPLPLPRTPVP